MREQGQSTVIQLDGELDLGSATELEQALELVWRNSPRLVVLDLKHLQFTDMAGLRVLMAAQEQAERQSWRLVLANVPDPVRRVMGLARISDVFTILENSA